MKFINSLRFLLFLIVLIGAMFVINLGFILFMGWALDKAHAILSWKWYWLFLFGFFAFIGLFFLWGVFKALVRGIVVLIDYISPYPRINANVISFLALINSIVLIYNVWSSNPVSSVAFFFLNVFFSIASLQLFLAFYESSKYNAYLRTLNQLREIPD